MLLFAVPFMINTDVILELWLKNVPEYTVGFCQLMVVYQLIDAFQAPLNMLIFSTGKKIFYEFSITLSLSSCSSENFSRNGFRIFKFYMGKNEFKFSYWRFYSEFTYCNYNYRYNCILDRNRKSRKEFLSFYSEKIPQDR